MSTDRNLLIGILALQNGFVVGNQLIAGMNAWVLEKETPLGEILVRQESLQPDELELLEALVNRHLAAHNNDPEQSLASLRSPQSFRETLRGVADQDVQASIAHLQNGHSADLRTLIVPTVGASTSAGSRFRILRPHAKGGLGEVFVAQDEELGREVALKQIQEQFADHVDSRVRFLLEAEITGGLEHPGIVPVYGLGADANGRPFYAMRFIRGDSLKDAIERFHKTAKHTKRDPSARSLELRKLLGRLIDVCNAIEYSHARGVLHRDLKPANIMLGKYGETLVVDWGMAKVIGRQDAHEQSPTLHDEVSLRPSPDSDSHPTQQGMAVGTPQYMSPEQAAGKHDELGPASDVYSLGATLYCLLTGKSPLADKLSNDVREVLRQVQNGEVTPPRQLKADIAKPLDAICRRAMAVLPADRYRSARAMADDLEHWLADEPTTARPEGLIDRLFRMARRHRALAITTTAAAILIAIVASAATVLINEQRLLADRLAKENLNLAENAKHSEMIALDAATKAIVAEEHARGLAKEKSDLAEKEKNARKEAEDSARAENAAKVEAVKLATEKTQLADDNANLAKSEQLEHEKADKLAEFLIGAIQPEDPARFTGVAFFAPKADYRRFTVIEMLRLEAKRAFEELNAEPLTQAAVLDSIGDVCRQLALFKDAEQLLNRALAIRREKLPANHYDLSTSCFHTAWYYHERGVFEKATPLYLEALAMRRELPKGEPLVAEILQNLAWLYYYEGHADSLKKMEQCFEEALHIRNALLTDAPAERRKTLLRDAVYTKLGIASAYAGKEQMLDAKRITSDQQLRDEIIELKGDHKLADALTAVVNAGDHIGLRQFAEAKVDLENSLVLLKEAGEIQTVMGALVTYDLGNCWRKIKIDGMSQTERLQQAEKWYQASISIIRRNEFFQIPEQSKRVGEVGELLHRLGKAPEADALWKEYLQNQEFRFGAQHKFYQDAKAAYRDFLAKNAAK